MEADMGRIVRMGAGSGFWGDALDPAEELLERANLDYLCFDYLAELTMALLQRQKLKRPDAGYVPDAVQAMIALLPKAKAAGTRLISNGGGVNPRAAADRIAEGARQAGLAGSRIALVEGDDMLGKLDELVAQGVPLRNLDTGDEDFAAIRDRVVCANVYTDSSGISEGLAGGADVVIAGRVSDNALYVGPLAHEFGWRRDAAHVDRYAAAVTLGHIVECAAGCSGGMSSRFAEMPHMGRVGFPILEVDETGDATVTKLPGSGGRVDQWTVKEHLVYEIGDPRRYLMPDAVADFTSLALNDEGQDRVRVSGMRGEPAPDQWKMVVGYQDGWIGETMAFFPWPNAYDRAVKARETLLERFERMGLAADQVHFDFVGLNTLHGPAAAFAGREWANELPEVGLRCAVRTRTQEEADKVRRAGTNLWIMGPGGTSFGTPMKPRPVIALWPTLIPRDAVEQKTEILVA
ncbi:acyclic terpene utilization AtuA family protein [Pigmentiphaga sp.]|uniref:acyclic terpene utilization AtuA family protein n=1 Tax=Pigmentiphaga sp. TaxID=1977564 RepID=UPI0025F39C83|nr:acyclic terpene utilization AtuA family protein [Pigmentiphaga sp.]